MQENFYNKYNEVYSKLKLMEKENVLFSWCKKNKTNYNELKELISFYSSTEENINKSNENFIERHLDSDRYQIPRETLQFLRQYYIYYLLMQIFSLLN